MKRTKFCYFLKTIKNKTNKCKKNLINMYYYNKINNLSNN